MHVEDQEPLEVRFANLSGDSLTIQVLGRSFPEARDFWDGNWLKTPISVRLGLFAAEIPASLRVTDFQRFGNELGDLYQGNAGAAVLPSLEDWIELNVEADGTGSLRIYGTLRDETGSGKGNELAFELIGLDQTFLPEILSALDQVLDRYPVLEG